MGPAWIIEGEHPGRYEQLLARVAEEIDPRDIIDWILLNDLVALTWEIQRSRRHRKTVIKMGRAKALEQILDQIRPPGLLDNNKTLASQYQNAETKAIKMFNQSQFSPEDIDAHAITVMAVELERIDLQAERHESRRESLLRQIERRREGWGKRVQRASEDFIEAEFSEIASRESKPGAAVGRSRSEK